MARTGYDAIVVGASLDGLVAAATLARARARVVVFEREDEVGGAAAAIPMPGMKQITACAAMPMVGLFRRRIFDELRLARRGVRLHCPDPIAWTPLPDGRSLALRADPTRTAAELRAFSEQDAAVWARFALWQRSLVHRLEPLLSAAPVKLERVVRAFRGDPGALRDVLFGSVAEVTRRHFETPALVASLSQHATSGTTLGPRDPGSFFHLLLRSTGDLFGPRGVWGHVTGGAARLALALRDAAVEAGAEVRTGTHVATLEVHRSKIRGVVLEDGSVVRARTVLSSLSERSTLLDLAPRGVVRARARAAIEARASSGTTFRLAIALDGLPSLAVARPAPGAAALAGTLRTARTLEEIDAAHADARAGHPAARPIVELTIPSTVDPTLAPPGVHLALVTAHHAPRFPRGASWERQRETFAERVLDVVEEIAPDLRSRIRSRVVLSPADLEVRSGSTGGHPSQGNAVPGRVFADRPIETPVPGLLLCGAAAHPGAAGTGVAGRLAGRAALRYLRRR